MKKFTIFSVNLLLLLGFTIPTQAAQIDFTGGTITLNNFKALV